MAHLDNPLLIHVAAESENRGRVVLAARTGAPHPMAVGAALAVAKAFDSWVDCLLIECRDVMALTAHGFAREVTFAGRIAPLSATAVANTLRGEAEAARQLVVAAAAAAKVRLATEIIGDTLASALVRACVAHGPWNIIALAEPIQGRDGNWLHDLLGGVSGATGIVVVGPHAAPPSGDVVIVVEDVERLPQMIRTAERLVEIVAGTAQASRAARISLLLAGVSAEHTMELDGQVRLVLPELAGAGPDRVAIVEADVAHGTHAEVAEALRRLDGGFVIARTGGLVVPADGNISALTTVLKCPLLLVR